MSGTEPVARPPLRPAEWTLLGFILYGVVSLAISGKFSSRVVTSIPPLHFIYGVLVVVIANLLRDYRALAWPEGIGSRRTVHNVMLAIMFMPSLLFLVTGGLWPDTHDEQGMVALVWGLFRVVTDFMTLTLFPLLFWLATGLYIKRHGRVSTVGLIRENWGPLTSASRDWLPPLAMLYAYGLLAPIVDHPFFPDRDAALKRFDRWLFFGHDPVLALERIISPALSEWLAGCYISYVFLFPVVLGAVYIKRDRARFRELAFATTLALAVGYIGYTLVPALGPVFTDTFTTKLDLYYFREIKEQLMDRTRVPRDCFPSLHTCLTMVLLWGAWRHARVVFWVLLPMAAFIPFACVYLRYHYVTDVLAGFVLFAIVVAVAPRLQARYERLYLAPTG